MTQVDSFLLRGNSQFFPSLVIRKTLRGTNTAKPSPGSSGRKGVFLVSKSSKLGVTPPGRKGILYHPAVRPFEEKVKRKTSLWAGNSFLSTKTTLQQYFGLGSDQSSDFLRIRKSDLPGIVPQPVNSAESLFASLTLLAITATTPDSLIQQYPSRFEALTLGGLQFQRIWILTDLIIPTNNDVDSFPDNTRAVPINPMNY